MKEKEFAMPLNRPEQTWLGYTIKVEPGSVLRPLKIHFWKEDEFQKHQPESPFYYKADALLGLSLVHLNQHLKNPFSHPKMNFPFVSAAWLALEPHWELYQRSQLRVNSLRQHLKPTGDSLVEYFERNFTDILDSALYPWGIDLQHLYHLIEAIEYLETKMAKPLLYNFEVKFPRSLNEKLHHLHSLLFNLRSVIAVDHNTFVQDASHEAVKVDSITDYLSKAEYVANDAMMYWTFKKNKEGMNPTALQNMEKAFKSYSHNGFCLIESLPKSFIQSLHQEELEESLYIAQMDWLLGTDAGLLFRIREELFGLREGYHKIFWPDAEGRPEQYQTSLEVSCHLTANDIEPSVAA